jgi:exopolyphosphatase/guanosine-5'-triphosphate,3'-diphosphate pyrophosphatase
VAALTEFVGNALELAEDKGCEEIYAFATSAVRDAANADEVLDHLHQHTGARIAVLAGEDEARLTFLAVRRWFGWSSGRLGVFDIGGGSLEVAAGAEEAPDVAWSLPLGAARLTRTHFASGRPDEEALRVLRRDIRAAIARDAGSLLRGGPLDHAVATSKTFRSLSRICGSAPSSEGLFVRRMLSAATLESWIPKLLEMSREEIARLPGVSPDRAHQVVAGAFVATAVMDIFDLGELEICPWALREGVILERLDKLSVLG